MHKQDKKNSSVDDVYCIFEDNYIFMGNLDILSRLYQPNPWNCNDNIWGAEKNKYTTFKTSINAWVFSDQISSLPRQL